MKNLNFLQHAKYGCLGLALVSSLIFSGCSGGGGSSSSSSGTPTAAITISGKVGTGYVVASAASNSYFARFLDFLQNQAYAAICPTSTCVNTIIALRTQNGDLTSSSVINSKTFPINLDGTFSLTLDNSTDWVLLLIDNTKTGAARFIGTVALSTLSPTGTVSADSLISLPTTSLTANSTIAVGTINAASGSVAQSASAVAATDFSLNATQLLTLAQTNDVYKNAKNLVMNYNPTTGVYYTLRPDFKVRGTYASINTTASDPLAYVYHHYNFQLDSNSNDVLSLAELCGTPPATSLKLYPPLGASAVSITPAVTYNDTTPITNDAAVCTGIQASEYGVTTAASGVIAGDFFASKAYTNISYSFGGYLDKTIPPGNWRYMVGNPSTLKGEFDVSAAAPLAATGALKGFVPSIKVNTDTTGKILSATLTWWVVDPAGTGKTPVTDLSILKHALGAGGVFFSNPTIVNGTPHYESMYLDPSTQTTLTPKDVWYFGSAAPAGAPAGSLASSIGIFYSSAGVGYFIEFFGP